MAATNAYAISGRIVDDINDERRYQVVEKGYTKEKDDYVAPHQWVDYLRKYTDNIDDAMSPEEFRRQLVKVAALAVAAIEASDRAVH